MKKIHFHIDEIDWDTFAEEGLGPLRWKELLNMEQGGSKEFTFGLAELPKGGKLSLHTHRQAETVYILSGSARIRLGLRSVELGRASAAYFYGGAPHSIETFGSESLYYLCTYACERLGHAIDWKLASEKEADQVDIINMPKSRWALREEIQEWVAAEPSKGFGVRLRRLFDHEHGNVQEMKVGIGEWDPGIHYTLHYHDQPEVYYILSGHGLIYVKDSAIEVSPGSIIYIEGRTVHGADSFGEQPLRTYYLYGTETSGQKRTWTPVEDIYTEIRWRK